MFACRGRRGASAPTARCRSLAVLSRYARIIILCVGSDPLCRSAASRDKCRKDRLGQAPNLSLRGGAADVAIRFFPWLRWVYRVCKSNLAAGRDGLPRQCEHCLAMTSGGLGRAALGFFSGGGLVARLGAFPLGEGFFGAVCLCAGWDHKSISLFLDFGIDNYIGR